MTWDRGALGIVAGLHRTVCAICGEETLYATHCAEHGPACLPRSAPKTCGRLKCMVATEETKAVV